MTMPSARGSSSGLSLVLLSVVISSLTLTWVSKPCIAVFLSIDCGGSDSFTDTATSIKWVGDDDYVRNGESREVQFSSLESTLTRSLRAFPTLNQNCYTVSLDAAGDRVLVRASFFYGNYDGMDSPPTFDLYFDGNFWTRVNMSRYVDKYIAFEVMYFANSDITNICLVREYPNQVPFITALVVRSLDATMYSHVDSTFALSMEQRYSQGTSQIIRYPDDAYDRIWYPARVLGSIDVENEATSIDVSRAEDKPPEAVFKTANTLNQTSSSTLTGIQLFTGLPATEVGIYMTIYFSEVTLLPPTQKRSFQVFIDGKPYSKPIVPPFGSVEEIYITNITASSSTLIELRPTPDSTLAPLINANELYSLFQVSTLRTHPHDREGLTTLQNQFEVLQMWSGDPCFPTKYTWEWVACSSDPIPRITALNLSGYGLFGSLPDLSSMDALVSINLHNNTLYGPIPEFLGGLPKLTLLDLSENRFNGSVPSTLSSNSKLKLLVTENCLTGMSCPLPLIPPPPPPGPKKNSPGLDNNPSGFDFGNGFQGSSGTNDLANMVLGAIIQAFSLAFMLTGLKLHA